MCLQEKDRIRSRHLLSFYRGLFRLSTAVCDTDHGSHAIADGFHDALVDVGISRTRQLFTVDGLRSGALELTQLATILPRDLDDALSSAAQDRASAAEDDAWMHATRSDLSNLVLWSVLLLIVVRQFVSTTWAPSLFTLLLGGAVALLAIAVGRALKSERRS